MCQGYNCDINIGEVTALAHESRYVRAHAFSHAEILSARQRIAGSSSDIVSLSGMPNHFLVKHQQSEQQQQQNDHHDNF